MRIPNNIYQTWSSKKLPEKMAENRSLLIKRTPGFKHYLYDDDDCRNFLAQHFKPAVLTAYDRLIPGAYKADLWRYCVLYINGGIYMDVKLNFAPGFDAQCLLNREHYPLDVFERSQPSFFAKSIGKGAELQPKGIYQAFLVCNKHSPILRKTILRCVRNIQTGYYGKDSLEPTGPLLLYDIIVQVNPHLIGKQVLRSKKSENASEFNLLDHYVMYGTKIVCYAYKGYRLEQYSVPNRQERYSVAWFYHRAYK